MFQSSHRRVSSGCVVSPRMRRVKPSPYRKLATPLGLDPLLVGTFYGAASALFYSAANTCLRAVAQYDPFLVSCVKAMPTLAAAGAVVGYRYWRGRQRWPSKEALVTLAVAGAIAQLGGNGAFQWSLGVVGLAIAVPLCSGTMIIAVALLARFWLGEGVTPRSALAMLVLIVSIVVLSFGSSESPADVERTSDAALVATMARWGVAAACFSGIAYATLNVTIRRLVTGAMPVSIMLLVVSSMGVSCLGTASLVHAGWRTIVATPPEALAMMVGAGAINACAFFLLGRALQWASAVEVNIVSASQTALAAVAGLLLFNEPFTALLVIGVLLSIAGAMLVDRGRPTVPRHAEQSDGPQ